jgi:hypothetical protein
MTPLLRLNENMLRVAEHYGLAWINMAGPDNPYCEVGHFVRKDGVRSADICLLAMRFTDEARKVAGREISKLLGYECEGSGI